MYTVIMPTMWKGLEAKIMLPLILNHSLVDEVLIFDNNREERPKDLSHDKIKFVCNGKNNFVNPCWNEGIRIAKNEYCYLYSDDVLFDESIFDFLIDKLDAGPIGVNQQDIINLKSLNNPNMVAGKASLKMKNVSIRIANKHEKLLPGWAMLLFINKSDYSAIPEELKIWFGDEWVWESNLKNGTLPRTLINYKIASHVETTSRANIEEIKNVKFMDLEFVRKKSIKERLQ